MLGFKSFIELIAEGGNVRFTNEKGEIIGSTPIRLDQRSEYMGHLDSLKSGLENHFGVPEGSMGWEGSTAHFMNKSIPDSEFKKAKKEKFGDADSNVPATPEVLQKMRDMKPGLEFGQHQLIHVHQSDDPSDKNGIYTLWKHKGTGQITQLDISPSPTDPEQKKMTDWIKTSPQEDLFPKKEGEPSLKGFASKVGAIALSHAMSEKNVMIRSPKGKSVKPGQTGFSLNVGGKGEPGMRMKTKPTGEVHENGLEIHTEIPAKEATDRIYDPEKMVPAILGKKTTQKDVSDFGSMRGIHRILHRHATPEQHQSYVDKVVNKLYGSSAQAVKRHDIEGGREEDHAAKDAVLDQVSRDFPEQFAKHKDGLDALKADYDARMSKPRKIQEDHVANHVSHGEVRGLGYVSGDISNVDGVVSQYVLDNIEYTKHLQHKNNSYDLYTFDDDNWWSDYKEMQAYKARNGNGNSLTSKIKAKFVATEEE